MKRVSQSTRESFKHFTAKHNWDFCKPKCSHKVVRDSGPRRSELESGQKGIILFEISNFCGRFVGGP